MKSFAFAVIGALALPVAPPLAAPTPEATLNDDVSGARVEWYGRIERRMAAEAATCFLLTRLAGGLDSPSSTFVTCRAGAFSERNYAPGRVLKVIGHLGQAIERDFDGEIINAPLVAAPRLELMPAHWRTGPPAFYGCDRRFDWDCDPFYGDRHRWGWHYWRRW